MNLNQKHQRTSDASLNPGKLLNRNRIPGSGYRIQVLSINGDEVKGDSRNHLSQQSLRIVNIGRGGFRFLSEEKFVLEDRVKVVLQFPDDHTQEVLGRICYSDIEDDNKTAYGFSVIDGFYSLVVSSA